MVTHDLRMVPYVDKVITMVDGRVEQITDERAVIDGMANTIHAQTRSDSEGAHPPVEIQDGEPESIDYEYAK